MKLTLFLFLLVNDVTSQWNYDESLKVACEQMRGVFKQRENRESTTGDTCNLRYRMASRDDDDARDFCELYAPWRLRSVERTTDNEQDFTTCNVEATFTCKSGWHQMFGHCFKMPDKHKTYTYDEAVETCKKENAEIAYLHHKYITGVWKRHFIGIGQIWVHASESWDQYVQKTNIIDGTALALAFTGKHYHFAVFANSLIRIKPTIRLQLLCQYKPMINAAEINYLGRRYSEIYYSTVPVEHGVLVRSASSYTRTTVNLEVCQKALKPFLSDKVDTFILNEDAMHAIGETKLEYTYLTRSGAAHPYDESKMEDVMCNVPAVNLLVKIGDSSGTNQFLASFTEKITCDNMLSAGITHFETPKLQMMSDSRSVPLWCKLGYPMKLEFTIPPGHIRYDRPNGEVVVHKLFKEHVYMKEASEICKKNGMLLSGISSQAEIFLLSNIARDFDKSYWGFWLGGQRKESCRTGYDINRPFEKDPNHECSQHNSFEWIDSVAQGYMKGIWRLEKHGENPNYLNDETVCVAFVIGDPDYLIANTEGYLDDVMCHYNKRAFFCQITLNANISPA